MSFYATLDPPIILPSQEEDQRTSSEEELLTAYAKKWMANVEDIDTSKGRNIKVMVPNSSGENVFITRYICPQNHPPNCNTEQQLVRYVSLLPFEEDTNEDGDTVHFRHFCWVHAES